MNAQRVWAFGTVVVIGAVLALGWVLGVSPLLGQAAEADVQRVGVEQSNTAQEARLAAMRADFERLDEIEAELGRLQVSIPGEVDSDVLYALLAGVMEGTGAVIDSVTTGEAQPYGTGMDGAPAAETSAESIAADAAAAAATEAELAAGAAEAAEGLTGSDGDDAAPVVPAPVAASPSSDLYTVPVTITFAKGTPVGLVVAYATALQNTPRLFIVTSVLVPATSDAQGTLTAYMFVMNAPDDTPGSAAGALDDDLEGWTPPTFLPWGPRQDGSGPPAPEPTESASPSPSSSASPTAEP